MTDRSDKWWASMVKKHGSYEAVVLFMRQSASKSRRNTGKKGGFASMTPERRKQIAKEAAAKRWAKWPTTTNGYQDTNREKKGE